jgi:hypothetical protein
MTSRVAVAGISLLAWSAGAASMPAVGQVTAEIRPGRPCIEENEAGQALNFDLLLENGTDATLTLAAIEVSVFDAAGRLELRRFVDANGTSPSIATVANRTLAPQQPTLVFNPFAQFDDRIELARLGFVLRFDSEEPARELETTVRVQPRVCPTRSDLRLPLGQRSIVYDGHDLLSHHRRFDYRLPPLHALGFDSNFMRYAYDFCPVDADGAMYRGDPQENASWVGFGQPVHAPAAGVVVALLDGMPDNRSFDQSAIATRPMILFGNHLVIDHGNGEWSVLGHLQQGSLGVKVGDRVRQGQRIARIGASGSANIPHFHYELQDGPDTRAEGLPATFRDFHRLLGSRRVGVKRGAVDSGDIIEP